MGALASDGASPGEFLLLKIQDVLGLCRKSTRDVMRAMRADESGGREVR